MSVTKRSLGRGARARGRCQRKFESVLRGVHAHADCGRCEELERAANWRFIATLGRSRPQNWTAGWTDIECYKPFELDRPSKTLTVKELGAGARRGNGEYLVSLDVKGTTSEARLHLILFWDALNERKVLGPIFVVIPANASCGQSICRGSTFDGTQVTLSRLRAAYPIVGHVGEDQLDSLGREGARGLRESFGRLRDAAIREAWRQWAKGVLRSHGPNVSEIRAVLEHITAPRQRQTGALARRKLWSVLSDIAGGEIAQYQQELSEFIRGENARLDRLIMTLYALFTLEAGREQDMFFSACHGIAEYFGAGDASILLTHYQSQPMGAEHPGADVTGIRCALRMFGAFGAWERSLHSPFVRQWQELEYPVPERLSPELGNTAFFWVNEDPVRLPDRDCFIRGADHPSTATIDDAPYHQVWLNKGLGTTCRGILAVSFRRPAEKMSRVGTLGEGVLKVENRRPRDIPAFGAAFEGKMLLDELWAVTSLRAYLRYLKRHAPEPCHVVNEVGWRRLYEQFGLDTRLFEEIRRRWYDFRHELEREQNESVRKTTVKRVTDALGQLLRSTEEVLRLTTLAETFLQHVQQTLCYLFVPGYTTSGSVKSGGPANVPGLFNVANVSIAIDASNKGRRLDREGPKKAFAKALSLENDLLPEPGAGGTAQAGGGRKIMERISTAMERLKAALLGTLLRDPSVNVREYIRRQLEQALNAAFAGESPTFDVSCRAALRQIGFWLQDLAEQIRNFTSSAMKGSVSSPSRLPLRLEEEYRRMRRCARQTLKTIKPHIEALPAAAKGARGVSAARLFGEESRPWYHPRGAGEDPLERALATALAEASMFAHTFAPVDEARLLFVSRRVWMLLSNRIIALAQRQGIHITHEHVRRFELDDFAVENLARLQREIALVGESLERAIVWWSGRHATCGPGTALPRITRQASDLRQLLDHATSLVASGAKHDQRPSSCAVLLTIHSDDPVPDALGLLAALGLACNGPGAASCRAAPGRAPRAGVWTTGVQGRLIELASASGICFELFLQLPKNRAELETSHWISALADGVGRIRGTLEQWVRDCESASKPVSVDGLSAVSVRPCPRALLSCSSDPPPRPKRESWEHRLQQLRRALDGVILGVEKADCSRELFAQIRAQLGKLCGSIAGIVQADSCGVFFLDEESKSMVMQGAFGRVKETFDASGRDYSDPRQSKIPGITYSSKWPLTGFIGPTETLTRNEVEAHLSGRLGGAVWPLTNQIWHLGEGRIAYSRAQFAEMRPGKGLGDKYAYPPGTEHGDPKKGPARRQLWTLRNIFRTFVGIPIFARGGQTDFVMRSDDASFGSPSAVRTEFHSQHRVVGILKLEGKQPNFDLIDDDWWDALSPKCLARLNEVLGTDRKAIVEKLKELYRADGLPVGDDTGFRLLARRGPGGTAATSELTNEVDSEFVDELTRALDARWQAEDIELLVAVAMEVGRLLTLFTLKKAIDQNVFLGESEVGVLGIRLSDIDQVVACKSVAEKVCQKVDFELRRIAAELESERTFLRQDQTAIPPYSHKMVHEIKVRPKEDPSLFAKLVEKQVARFQEEWRSRHGDGAVASRSSSSPSEPACPCLKLEDFALRMPDLGLQSPRRVIRGQLEMLAERQADGTFALKDVGGDLYVGESRAQWLPDGGHVTSKSDSFSQRVFDRFGFALDDWAAGRVTCGFLSDVTLLLDAICGRFPQRGICIDRSRIQSWLESPQPDGYRAVHATVYVPIESLATPSESDLLSGVLPRYAVGKGELKPCFPCEIQIRTAYQGSWAKASHDIEYKNPDVHPDLRRYMSCLSGLLYESDKIMEVVLERIEAEDPKLLELLLTLRQSLPYDEFALVQFAAFAAQEIHRRHRLYGGRPHYARLIDVAYRLARSFAADDPYLILLAFFQDLWLHDSVAPSADQIQGQLVQKLQTAVASDASGLLGRLNAQIMDAPQRICQDAPEWFWTLLGVCCGTAAAHADVMADRRLRALEQAADRLRASRCAEDEIAAVIRIGCVLETASQLSRLQELPSEPLRGRAVEELGAIYRVLHHIRHWIGGDVRSVLQCAEHELHDVATRLDTHLPTELNF